MSRLWLVAALTAALTLSGTLAAPGTARAQPQRLSIPTVTPASPWALLKHEAPAATVAGELTLPAQASGPVPALILKHGSGGMSGPNGANIKRWAAVLNGWGVATLTVDSFAPRGLSETASDQGQLSTWADVADALAALKVLGADRRIDRTRIGIIGWSRGGSVAFQTALESVRKSVIADDLKFAVHIVLYGSATTQYRDRGTDRSPILFLHGEADNYVPIGPTREFADWMKTMGNPVTFVGYPGTYHDFDVETGPQGFAKSVEIGRRCDLVIDLTNGHVKRMDHQADPTTTPDGVRAYMRSCTGHGADLVQNGAARADAIEKVHGFLKEQFHIAG
jgi:dienelactone hydrolase